MAKKSKRVLSVLLTLIMILGLLPTSVFAYEQDQVLEDGYFTVSKDGVATEVQGEIGPVTDQGYTVSKTIHQTGENAFDITLEVETSETVTTSDAAVVLVLDTSASMDVHMYNLKEAAKSFVSSLVTNNNGGKIYVSVVGFGGYAYKVCDWEDVTAEGGISEVNRQIGSLKAGSSRNETGGTNLEAGLMLARNRLGMAAVSTASAKYTVLFTDGEPTFRVTKESNSTEFIENITYDRSGTDCSEAERNEAAAMAGEVKELSKLYTICYGAGEDILYGSDKCVNCGQPRRKHDERYEGWWPFGDYHYYCRNGSGKEYKSSSVTMSQYLENEIATPAADDVTYAYDAEDSEQLNAAFVNIASSVSDGNTGAGTQVVDPMGQFINFGEVDENSVKGGAYSYDPASKTLTWTLNPDEAQKVEEGNKTTYKFKLTYSITLDTAAEGFQETKTVTVEGEEREVTKYYPTNGYTSLKVPGENDIVFNVPGVCGEIPESSYTIEYYKWDKELKDYPETPTKSEGGTAKVGTPVNPPEDYKKEYESDHYSYDKGDPASITVKVNPAENVIRLYYKPDTARIIVNHYYREDVTDVNGNTTVGTYGTPDTDPPYTGYVGDRYPENGEVALKTQGGIYKLVTSMDEAGFVSDDRYIDSVSKDGNVINLYYVKDTDYRLKASVTLQKNYETWEWKLNPATGRYEETLVKNEAGKPETVVAETRIPANHTQQISDETGYTIKSITANGEEVTRNGDKNIVFALQEGENPIVVTYKKITNDRGDPVNVTVNHIYTKNNWTVSGDGLVNNPDPDGVIGYTETIPMYVGETYDFARDSETGYRMRYPAENGDTYASHSTPTSITVQPVVGQEDPNVVNIYYTLDRYPGTASFTVNNHFRTWVSVVDPATGDVSWVIGSDDGTDTETYPLEGSGATYYVGQTHTVPTNPEGRTGYTQDLMKDWGDKNVSDVTIKLEDGENVANVYFDKKEGEEPDTNYVTVIHKYYKEVETVKNGVVTSDKRFEGETSETHWGVAGATYTITPVTDYDGNPYKRDDDVSLTASYDGRTVILTYVRDGGSELTATDLTVTHNYFVKNMTVEDGVAGYYEDPVSEGSTTTYVVKDKNGNVLDHDKLYVGMEVTVEPVNTYTVNGVQYTYKLRGMPNCTLTLGTSGTNSLTLNYDREVPLNKVTVTVSHTYLLHEYSYEGGNQEITTSNEPAPWSVETEMYVGETYTAVPVAQGYTLTSAKDGESDIVPVEDAYKVKVGAAGNNISFVYEKDTGKRAPATVMVYHYYTEIDWDGTKTGCGTIGYEAEKDEPVSSYAGLTYTATAKLKADENGENGYTLVDKNSTPAFDDGLTITLQEGLNEIHLYYEKKIDTRQSTKVMVIHNYYARDTYTTDDNMSDADYIVQENVKPEYRTERVYDSVEDGVWVGKDYTATMYDTVYYKDEEGVASIERKYNLVNATPEGGKIVSAAALDNGQIPEGNVVTFNLIREYSTDPGTVTYTVVHEYYSSGRFMGSTQSTETGKPGSTVSADDIGRITSFEGRNYSYLSADPETMVLAADGENVMTLRYTRSSGGGGGGGGSTDPDTDPDPGTDIEDPDVPTTDLPDVPTGEPTEPVEEPTEIEEPEVPMAEAPETGDSNFAYLHLLSLASALGLVALFLSDKRSKKHRDEA